MPVELHFARSRWRSTRARGGFPMGSCHVPDRRRRYGVEKDSFATLIGHWRTGHRMASRRGEPGALLLITFIGQSRFD